MDAYDDHGQPTIRGYNESRRIDRSVSEFLGILKGVLADKKTVEEEVQEVALWGMQNPEARQVWPVNVVLNRIDAALADRVVDNSECDELHRLFRDVVGDPLSFHDFAEGPSNPTLLAAALCVFAAVANFRDARRASSLRIAIQTMREERKTQVEYAESQRKKLATEREKAVSERIRLSLTLDTLRDCIAPLCRDCDRLYEVAPSIPAVELRTLVGKHRDELSRYAAMLRMAGESPTIS